MESPQSLLDQIYATGIFALSADGSSTTEDRAQQARTLRPELQRIRSQVREAQTALGARQSAAAESQLTPYLYLDEILDKLEVALRAYITDPATPIPHYGRVFFGDPKQDDWHLGTPQQAQIWKLERQQQALAEQIVRAEEALEGTRRRLKTTRQELMALGSAVRRVLLVVAGLLMIATGIGATVTLHHPIWLAISAAGVLLGGVGAVRLNHHQRQRRQLIEMSRRLRTQGQALAQTIEALQAKQIQLDHARSQLQKRY